MSVTLRAKLILKVFEKDLLRKKLILKNGEVTGEWRKVFNVKLHTLWVKAKQSLDSPGQALRVPENRGLQISKQSAHEDG